MNNPAREHLAGLRLALDRWNDGGPSIQYAKLLHDLIDQAKAAPAEADSYSQADSIAHLTKCADDTCERCENLMYFYQACDECGAWGHNDAGPCLCTSRDAPADHIPDTAKMVDAELVELLREALPALQHISDTAQSLEDFTLAERVRSKLADLHKATP